MTGEGAHRCRELSPIQAVPHFKDFAPLVRERRNGAFHRAIRLPDTVDAENPEAGYEHGVLTVTFPKIEAKKARRVEVKVKS